MHSLRRLVTILSSRIAGLISGNSVWGLQKNLHSNSLLSVSIILLMFQAYSLICHRRYLILLPYCIVKNTLRKTSIISLNSSSRLVFVIDKLVLFETGTETLYITWITVCEVKTARNISGFPKYTDNEKPFWFALLGVWNSKS